jgi:enolase
MPEPTIQSLSACEVLDSRGRPTLEVHLTTSDGITAAAQVPSGASTGKSEAHELRDGDPLRHAGLGVQSACRNVAEPLLAAVQGLPITHQQAIDESLIAADGSPNKQRLGANAILGISCAAARAAALSTGQPLWQYLAANRQVVLPLPMVNILSGGLHASQGMEFQDFLAIPHAADSFRQAMEWICRIHAETRRILLERNITLTGVADEGGWGPRLASNEEALAILTLAIEQSGLQPGSQVTIAIDVASSHFHRDGQYLLGSEGRSLSASGFIAHLETLVQRYPVTSIEDGLEQDDWTHWPALTAALGSRCQIIGDDFLTTNPSRVRRAIDARAANAVLVKMNQIGTLTETFAVIDQARAAGWRAVISARSGETEDSFLADLAIASGMAQIKVGSITRSERLAKYNRLLVLEQQGGIPHWSQAPALLPTSRG